MQSGSAQGNDDLFDQKDGNDEVYALRDSNRSACRFCSGTEGGEWPTGCFSTCRNVWRQLFGNGSRLAADYPNPARPGCLLAAVIPSRSRTFLDRCGSRHAGRRSCNHRQCRWWGRERELCRCIPRRNRRLSDGDPGDRRGCDHLYLIFGNDRPVIRARAGSERASCSTYEHQARDLDGAEHDSTMAHRGAGRKQIRRRALPGPNAREHLGWGRHFDNHIRPDQSARAVWLEAPYIQRAIGAIHVTVVSRCGAVACDCPHGGRFRRSRTSFSGEPPYHS
jgi:hypothetical protein